MRKLTIEEFEKEMTCEKLCNYCRHNVIDGCRGITQGYNGEPCYPPCANYPEEVIEDAYERYLEED